MPTVIADVGGFVSGTKHVATLRLQSPDKLDVVMTADGSKTVLALLKEVVAEISTIGLPDPVPAAWSELAVTPPTGTEVVLSVGILVKHNDA